MDRKGETNFFTSEMIKQCMKKVIAVNLHEVIKVYCCPVVELVVIKL